jgi:hypothetical protein
MNPIRAGYFFYELYIFARATIMDDTNQAMMVAILVILIFVVAWYMYRRANPEAVGSFERLDSGLNGKKMIDALKKQKLLDYPNEMGKLFSECDSYAASTEEDEDGYVANLKHYACNGHMQVCSSLGVENQDTCNSVADACMPFAMAKYDAMREFEKDAEAHGFIPTITNLPTNPTKRKAALTAKVDVVNAIAPHVPQCIKAIKNVSPKYIALFVEAANSAGHIGLPTAQALALLRDANYIDNVKNAITTAPGLINLFHIRD